MKEKTYKCSFKHCQHESCELSQGEAVKIGNRYMHKDCAETSGNLTKIRDLYYEKISKTVVMSQLINTINNIVFKKNVDSGYLLFALNHAISAKISVKSPYGLHYLIDNQRIKQLWEKKMAQKIVEEMKEKSQNQEYETQEVKFTYNAEKDKGFGNLLGGI